MDVFCLAYIFLLTACISLLVVLVIYAIKSEQIQFKGAKATQNRISQLRDQRWLCIRYIAEDNGKKYIREDEIPFSQLMELILANVEFKYGDVLNKKDSNE